MRPALPALCALLFATAAPAQERVLTPERAAGVDHIVLQCISFVRMDFANGMCDRLSPAVATLAQDNGLTLTDLGRGEWGFGQDVYRTDPEADGQSLHLTFYIRATDNPVSASLWASLYRLMPDGSGRLVLWEDSGIGAGRASTITRGLSDGLVAKLTPVFEALGKGRPG